MSVNEESFLKDVENHKVEIMKDDGLYRHLHCSDGSFNRHFDIVTYPGHLCISGDMGTFVFQRVQDMFNFFRGDGDKLSINPRYWSEKLQAQSMWGGLKKFDVDLVTKSIEERVEYFCEDIDYWVEKDSDKFDEDYSLEEIERRFRDEIENHFAYAELDRWRFFSAIESFSSNVLPSIDFTDDYDWIEYEEYSSNYIWLIYAITWAVDEYDKLQELKKELDDCEICHGKSGGIKGNENIINGVVTCDYCHSAVTEKGKIIQ